MEFDKQKLAANLRAERARKGFSQEKVANAIDVSSSAVRNWESAENIPGVESMFALADLYDTSIDELCGHPLPCGYVDLKQPWPDASP